MNYLKVFVDDKEISTDRSFTNAISIALDSSKKETKAVKCTVCCVDNFCTFGTTQFYFEWYNNGSWKTEGGNVDKFALCLDEGFTDSLDALANGTWVNTITTEAEITKNKNFTFWVKATSINTEEPATDDTISLTAKYTVKNDEVA